VTRRDITLLVALALLVGLMVAAKFISVPYVILEPGPVTDTLGAAPAAHSTTGTTETPVISISGTKTQPSSGHIYLTTVQSLPCGHKPTLWTAVKGWFDKHDAVEPYQVECPPDQTSQQVQQQEQAQMSESQSHAIIAAFRELGYKSTGNRLEISSVQAKAPAAKYLQRGDVIETVNGKQVRDATTLVNLVHSVTPPDPIRLSILRNNQRLSVSPPTFEGPKGTMIGIGLRIAPSFNGIVATIGIDPRVIGGPSAGTALALGIIDKLTPGGLTGGRTIAGTGTVSPAGKVGPIGGIQQKIAAAAATHATVFFAPASECSDAKSAAPASMTLVSATTLHEVVTALQAIKSGSTNFPHC
jgi:PDZ domain-containing protein